MVNWRSLTPETVGLISVLSWQKERKSVNFSVCGYKHESQGILLPDVIVVEKGVYW